MGQGTIIKWGKNYVESYNYGSKIIIGDEKVIFSSPMMPVGAKIKKWNSKGNYSVNRSSPLLPLLIGGCEYHLEFFIKKDENNSLLYSIEFYDKFNNSIDIKYFNDEYLDFLYPVEAVSYEISLINKKHKQIEFYFMILLPTTSFKKNNIQATYKSNILKVIAEESGTHTSIYIDSLERNTITFPTNNFQNEKVFFIGDNTGDTITEALIQIISEINTTEVSIWKGNNFATLSPIYSLIPYVIEKVLPKIKVSTNICNKQDLQEIREIRKYTYIISQMLERKLH